MLGTLDTISIVVRLREIGGCEDISFRRHLHLSRCCSFAMCDKADGTEIGIALVAFGIFFQFLGESHEAMFEGRQAY